MNLLEIFSESVKTRDVGRPALGLLSMRIMVLRVVDQLVRERSLKRGMSDRSSDRLDDSRRRGHICEER